MRQLRFLLLLVLAAGSLLQLSGCVAAAGVGFAVGATASNDKRTTGAMVDDQVIEFKVIDRVKSDEPLWKDTHLNATSVNNIVLLTGETSSNAYKTRIGQLAAGVPKVRKVHNEIVIAAPTSLLSRSNDSWLTGTVKTQLLNAMGGEALRVKVVTENSVVYLMGILSPAEADQATDVTRRIGGVKRVVRLFEYTE